MNCEIIIITVIVYLLLLRYRHQYSVDLNEYDVISAPSGTDLYRVARNKIPYQTICNISATSGLIFTALHAMQTRSSDENSVRLSVCPSVCHTRVL